MWPRSCDGQLALCSKEAVRGGFRKQSAPAEVRRLGPLHLPPPTTPVRTSVVSTSFDEPKRSGVPQPIGTGREGEQLAAGCTEGPVPRLLLRSSVRRASWGQCSILGPPASTSRRMTAAGPCPWCVNCSSGEPSSSCACRGLLPRAGEGEEERSTCPMTPSKDVSQQAPLRVPLISPVRPSCASDRGTLPPVLSRDTVRAEGERGEGGHGRALATEIEPLSRYPGSTLSESCEGAASLAPGRAAPGRRVSRASRLGME